MAQSDLDGGFEALQIGPVVEGGEPISAGVRRRKRQCVTLAKLKGDRLNVNIGTDCQRSFGELDEERRVGMNVPVTVATEPD